MYEQLAILSVQYFSNLYFEQILVKELKSSWVYCQVLTLVSEYKLELANLVLFGVLLRAPY